MGENCRRFCQFSQLCFSIYGTSISRFSLLVWGDVPLQQVWLLKLILGTSVAMSPAELASSFVKSRWWLWCPKGGKVFPIVAAGCQTQTSLLWMCSAKQECEGVPTAPPSGLWTPFVLWKSFWNHCFWVGPGQQPKIFAQDLPCFEPELGRQVCFEHQSFQIMFARFHFWNKKWAEIEVTKKQKWAVEVRLQGVCSRKWISQNYAWSSQSLTSIDWNLVKSGQL